MCIIIKKSRKINNLFNNVCIEQTQDTVKLLMNPLMIQCQYRVQCILIYVLSVVTFVSIFMLSSGPCICIFL